MAQHVKDTYMPEHWSSQKGKENMTDTLANQSCLEQNCIKHNENKLSALTCNLLSWPSQLACAHVDSFCYIVTIRYVTSAHTLRCFLI